MEQLSVTEAGRRGIARLVADAAHGDEVVVERHGNTVAAVVGIERAAQSSRRSATTSATSPSRWPALPTTTGTAPASARPWRRTGVNRRS